MPPNARISLTGHSKEPTKTGKTSGPNKCRRFVIEPLWERGLFSPRLFVSGSECIQNFISNMAQRITLTEFSRRNGLLN